MDNSILEQLIYLRRLTELTGVLHEAQIQHIKVYWGLLSNSTGKEFGIDFENKIIEFRLPITGIIEKKYSEQFLEGLTFIVGKGWRYKFIRGDQEFDLLYE